MKKTLVFLFAAIMVCSFAFYGCGQSGDSSNSSSSASKKDPPSDVMEKALKSLKNKDYKGTFQYTAGIEEASEEDLEQMAALVEMLYEANGGLKDYEILDEEISEDGQTAKVTVKYTFGNGTEKEDRDKLLLTESGWKIKE